MFGGKKGRVLEQEFQELQEKQTQQEQVLGSVAQKKDMFEEQFARVTASRAQMDKELSEVVNHVKYVKELAGADVNKAERFEKSIAKMAEDAKVSREAGQNFLEKVKAQRNQIQEVVEKNKHFTTPTKYLTEFSGEFKESEQEMLENLGKMQEFAKNMSVLSLNAAIEAGRMGEEGKDFIAAAEEVRAFSWEYDLTAKAVEKQLRQLEEKNDALEEQVKHLTALLRENNISMGHLLKESMVCVDEYQNAKKEIEEKRFEELKKSAGEFCEHQREIGNREDCILVQMEEIGKEFMEQKECVDELEKVCKEVTTSAIM